MQDSERIGSERSISVAVAAALAFNYPILKLFGHPDLVFGIPVLYLYLFAVWIAVIVCVGRVMRQPGSDGDNPR